MSGRSIDTSDFITMAAGLTPPEAGATVTTTTRILPEPMVHAWRSLRNHPGLLAVLLGVLLAGYGSRAESSPSRAIAGQLPSPQALRTVVAASTAMTRVAAT